MRESVFQQIWKDEALSSRGFVTLCNQRFRVLSAGEHNPGDGPDFKNARLQFEDGTILAGDIELHISEAEWFAHNHQTDPGYNSVILHVFLSAGIRAAVSPNGTSPLRLDFTPYLSATMVSKVHRPAALPCTPALRYISEDVMKQQLVRARREYFDARIGQLSELWRPGSNIQSAFSALVFIAMAEGLGIERNRKPMRLLAEKCYDAIASVRCSMEAENILVEASGLVESSRSLLNRQEWDFSGSRPGNKPKDRIHQLGIIAANLHKLSARELVRSPDSCWNRLTEGVGSSERMELLAHLVWYPAVYLLGSMVRSETLCGFGYQSWENRPARVPAFILEELRNSGFPKGVLEPHLGLVHQFKRYCRAGACGSCEVGRASGVA
ncbi:MAG: DUF2851 family protein [Balneolia bacterium]|nr:DUF2851 family protein [Balneolia bacterium]